MRIQHSRFKLMLTAILLLPACYTVLGQPGNPGSGPVGGGLIFLILSGLAVGFFGLRKKNKGPN